MIDFNSYAEFTHLSYYIPDEERKRFRVRKKRVPIVVDDDITIDDGYYFVEPGYGDAMHIAHTIYEQHPDWSFTNDLTNDSVVLNNFCTEFAAVILKNFSNFPVSQWGDLQVSLQNAIIDFIMTKTFRVIYDFCVEKKSLSPSVVASLREVASSYQPSASSAG